MIHAVSGIVQAKKKQGIVLVIGPLTLDIAVADESLFVVDKNYTVLTYLHWNQEQGPLLYGFKEEMDRAVFMLVISCSGVGPRLGLSILADVGAAQCIEAIHKGDDRILSKVTGIGTKKAEHIIVQLKHKVQDLVSAGMDTSSTSQVDWHTISDALRALNYSRGEVSQAIAFLRTKNDMQSPASFDQLLRQALSFLSKQQ